MRLLVTGGCGSLGSNLIEHLADRCAALCVVDNLATGKQAALPPLPHLEFVETSIVDATAVNEVFDHFRPTHVIHSAASYKHPDDWATDVNTNTLGTVHVVRASERHDVQRFINFQTALCYGRAQVTPIPVDHPTAPFTSYGISKTAGEAFVAASALPWVSLRIANVTGPRLAIGPIPAFYQRLQQGQACSVSTTVRDFLDMSDFVALVDVLLTTSTTGIFHASSGEGHSIAEIFQLVAQHLGHNNAQPASINPPSPDDVASVVLDPTRTTEVFGWAAQTSFATTIQRMLHWYDEHGVTDVYSHLQGHK
jgi:nucleoside-diphosphate-sugar epimerase